MKARKVPLDTLSDHLPLKKTSLNLYWSTAEIRVSRASRLYTPPLGGDSGNGLPQWNQSRPYDHIYISRKPRPVSAVGRGGELHLILPFHCTEPGHMAAYRIETIRKLKAKGIVIASRKG